MLPSSLQTLTFGLNFDQTLAGVTLPSSLQTLKFGELLNQSLGCVMQPSSLQTLTLGRFVQSELRRCDAAKQLGDLDLWAFVQWEFGVCDAAKQPADFDLWTLLQWDFGRCDIAKQLADFDLWVPLQSTCRLWLLELISMRAVNLEGCQDSSKGEGGLCEGGVASWKKRVGGASSKGEGGFFEEGRGGSWPPRRNPLLILLLHPDSTKKPTPPWSLTRPLSLPLPFFEEATTPLQDSQKGRKRDRRPCQRLECE